MKSWLPEEATCTRSAFPNGAPSPLLQVCCFSQCPVAGEEVFSVTLHTGSSPPFGCFLVQSRSTVSCAVSGLPSHHLFWFSPFPPVGSVCSAAVSLEPQGSRRHKPSSGECVPLAVDFADVTGPDLYPHPTANLTDIQFAFD